MTLQHAQDKSMDQLNDLHEMVNTLHANVSRLDDMELTFYTINDDGTETIIED